jgi:hypothetical protein
MMRPVTMSSTVLIAKRSGCTTMSYTALPAPMNSSHSATGISTLSGLKYITIRNT